MNIMLGMLIFKEKLYKLKLSTLIKKAAGIEAMPALTIETLIVTPMAEGFIGFKLLTGT